MGEARGMGLGGAVPRRDGRRRHRGDRPIRRPRRGGRLLEEGRFEVPVVDFFIDGSAAGEFLGRFARAGAKLEWTAWNPAESGAAELRMPVAFQL